jgi:hypothetical protein
VNHKGFGTKAAPHYVLTLGPGESQVVQLRLYAEEEAPANRRTATKSLPGASGKRMHFTIASTHAN